MVNKKECLVIIDMQKGFINEHTEHIVSPLIDFIKEHKFDVVVATQYVNSTDTACYIFENWHNCMKGEEETKILDELHPFIDKVFEKNKYSCWNDEFKSFVKDEQIDVLYFVGVNTGCCVLHSAFDAYNDLQECIVVADLCGSTSGESSHQAALQILSECITKERVINFGTSNKLNIKRQRYVVMTSDKKQIFVGIARNMHFRKLDELGDITVKTYLSEAKAKSSFLQSWSNVDKSDFEPGGKYTVVPINEIIMEV